MTMLPGEIFGAMPRRINQGKTMKTNANYRIAKCLLAGVVLWVCACGQSTETATQDNRAQPVAQPEQNKPEKKLNTTETKKLLVGKSKKEVIQILGKPDGVIGDTLWIYKRSVITPDTGIEHTGFYVNFANLTGESEVVSVRFDKEKVSF